MVPIPKKFDNVPDDVKKKASEESTEPKANVKGKYKPMASAEPLTETRQKRLLFKKKRAGVVLSKEEVKAIKKGRRKLRKEMKQRGIRSKREFEIVAGSLGLYFDKNRGFLAWLSLHWLGVLIGALAALMLILAIFAMVSRLRGHFTINLSDDMFHEGFVLSETIGFEHPTVELFAEAAEDVPCISIKQLPKDLDEIDGQHNGEYFAYTYYIRNDGQSTVNFTWELALNSESRELSDAAWVILFEDGEMRIFAKANKISGEAEALPAKNDNTRGYLDLQIMDLAPEDSGYFDVVRKRGRLTYYRVIPEMFESDLKICSGEQTKVKPGDVHKYTVVIWLEGDDIDTDNSKIGGHLGMQMNFRLSSEQEEGFGGGAGSRWRSFWNGLKFW